MVTPKRYPEVYDQITGEVLITSNPIYVPGTDRAIGVDVEIKWQGGDTIGITENFVEMLNLTIIDNRLMIAGYQVEIVKHYPEFMLYIARRISDAVDIETNEKTDKLLAAVMAWKPIKLPRRKLVLSDDRKHVYWVQIDDETQED